MVGLKGLLSKGQDAHHGSESPGEDRRSGREQNKRSAVEEWLQRTTAGQVVSGIAQKVKRR